MSKAFPDGPSIQATMEDQLRKTMDVVQSMRGNAEQLLSLTERIIVKLDEGLPPQDLTSGTMDRPAPDPHPQVMSAAVPMAQETHDALVAAVTKATVAEVMATINPVLGSLQKFISDNARAQPTVPEADEEAFAEKLVEELKHSLARRTRIALARKKFTAP
jgi:hypothetical protein